MLGRRVGHYQVVAKLGEGAMGSVWKADDGILGRTVAIKFLADSLVDSPQARRRFLREARATSSLKHPGIATLYEAGEDRGNLYYAAEFVDGETVADRVAAGVLPVADAVRTGLAVAEALSHAHECGLIHRDVSPRNIMVARDGRVVLIDFGLARQQDSSGLTSSGTTIGTVAYLSPEVLLGNSADHRSDLWSLGVVLYEMLAGTHPFPGDRSVAVIYRIINEKPVPPSGRRPGLDPRLDRIVLKAMAKTRERRYQSAAEMAADLRGLAATEVSGEATVRTGDAARPRKGSARGRTTATALPARKCLAVLPFKDLADAEDPQGEALALGLSETLCDSLSRVPQLQVIPPSQTTRSPDHDEDLQATARKLGANLVLSGNVRRSGTQIRISYSLLDPRRRTALAGDKLDGPASDLFALEDALLASVTRALRVEAAAKTPRMLNLAQVAAHAQYLQALGYLQRPDHEPSVDGAITILEGLVATEGATALVHAALGKAYERKLHHTRNPEWKAKAEASCRLSLGLDPHSPEALVTLARLELRNGRHDQAIETLNRALELRRQNPDALLLLSKAYEGQGRFRDSEAAAQEAIALRPGYWLGYERLGLSYFRQGQYERSAEQWRRVEELAPDNATVHYNLGAAYFQLGRLEDAHNEYRRAIDILPQATAYSGLGTVCFFLGRNQEAIAMFEKAAALTPRDPRVWRNLGDAQRWIPGFKSKSAESFDRAIGLLQEQVEADPRDAEGWSQLARCLSKRERVAESLAAIRRAVEIAPGNVNCLARAITVYELAGDRERSLEFLKAAVSSGYGLVELERDPELEDLRRDPAARRILTDEEAMRSGMEAESPREERDHGAHPKTGECHTQDRAEERTER